MSDDKFNKAFEIPDDEPSRELEIIQPASTSTAEEDFNLARENLYSTIEHVQFALDDLAGFAKSAQSARVYEVLANMIKTSIDASKGLLDLQKQRMEIAKNNPAEYSDGPRTVNNNLYLSTADFQRMIEEHHNKKEDDES